MVMRASAFACLALLLSACGGEPTPDTAEETPAEALDPAIAAAAAAEAAALATCGAVTAEGYCGIRFGMTAEAAAAAFPVQLESYEIASGETPDPARCHELFAVEPVTGFSLLVENNAVGRVDFLTPTARTSNGFGVGSKAAAIRAAFGAAVSETPSTYEPEITDLSVAQGAAKFVFEIDDDIVRSWRAGVAPSVDYPAHCG